MTRYRIFAAGAAALFALGSIGARSVRAQDGQGKVAEPEYNLVVFALDPANGALIPLERKQGNVQSKIRGLGFGGAKASTAYSGESSPVRFKPDRILQFIMRFDNSNIDPSTIVTLESLTKGKGRRELETFQVGAFGTRAGTETGKAAHSLNFARYGEHSYRFTPADPLTKGEYAVMPKGATEAFLFGID